MTAVPPPWKYHFAHAPNIFYAFWSLGALAVAGSWAVAVQLLKQHLQAARTEDPLFLPDDSRKALIIAFVAPVSATIQFTTLLSPRSALTNSLLAACVQSYAQLTFVAYMMCLLGGPRFAAGVLGRLRSKWWGWLVSGCCRRCGARPCCAQTGFTQRHFRWCYYLSIQNALLVPLITLICSQAEKNGDDEGDGCEHVAFTTSESVGFLMVVSTIASVLSLQTLRRAVICLLEPATDEDPDADPSAGRWDPGRALAEGYGELAAWPSFNMNSKFLAMKAVVIVSGVTSSLCSTIIRRGYDKPVAAVCGGCPCYDRSLMAQMWTAFSSVLLLVPVALLAAHAYPVEPVSERARDVLNLSESLALRG